MTLAREDLNEINGPMSSGEFLCQISLGQFTDVTLVYEGWMKVKVPIKV